jgi:hypothetical protein
VALSPAEIVQIFDNSVPKHLQEALIHCIFGAYKTAFEDCSRFPDEEARDLRPFVRWTQIRSDLRGLPARFPGIQASAEPYHTLVTAGHIILTASAVDAPDVLPRPAQYRLEYASTSQLDLFNNTDGEFIYAILLHHPDPTDHRQPLFALIAFPDRFYEGYVYSVDLFARFESLVASLRIPKEEGERGLPKVQPKKADQKKQQA